MIKRILAVALAAGAGLALAGTAVVALAFALYAALKPLVTPAGASACVALACALVAGVGFLVFVGRSKGKSGKADKHHEPAKAEGGFGLDRMLGLARERPIAAAAAAVAAGVIALRNPALVGVATRMFLEPKRPPARR